MIKDIYTITGGGARPLDKRGGGGGNHPDPEISGGRAGLRNKFFFGPSGLSLVQKSESRCPMIIFLNLLKVRARAEKVIFVCCFRDPRGLLSRERDMFRRQTFEA